jgi:outer membrane protein assembly factor BamA
VAELAQRADLSLIDPWILGSNATANVTVFWNRRQEPSFQRLEEGVELGARWRLSEDWRVRTAWQYRRSDASQIEVDAPQLVEDVDVSEFTVEPTWDTRDAFENPRRGHQTRGSADVSADALGSQIEYVRMKVEHAQYVSFGSKTTLAAMGRVGVIAPIGDTEEIPIQERFFNGGENSVRSYEESELGPKDQNGQPVGGEASTTFSVELRYMLTRRVQAALFVDAGDVALEYEDVFDFQDVGFGIGLGLRYLLPIGPVRVDGAWNPDPEEDESTGAIHVSVGFSF